MAGEKTWQEEVWDIHLRALKKSGIRPGTDEDIRFLALALGGEAGELQNLIKKTWRGDFTIDEAIEEIQFELADIQVYLELLGHCLRIDLDDAVLAKMPEIRRKFPRARKARAKEDDRFDESRQ